MSEFGKIFFIGGRGLQMSDPGNYSGAINGQDIWQPASDLIEVEGGYLIQMDLPGVDASSVEVYAEGQRITIRGVRRAMCPSRGKKYIHMEVSRGEFGKVITLPEPINADGCSAALRSGVLEIFLPFGVRHMYSMTTIVIKTLP